MSESASAKVSSMKVSARDRYVVQTELAAKDRIALVIELGFLSTEPGRTRRSQLHPAAATHVFRIRAPSEIYRSPLPSIAISVCMKKRSFVGPSH